MFNVFELTEDFITLWEEGTFLTGVLETLYLTFISTLLAYLVGIPVGVILNITSKNGIRPNKWINIPLGIIVNIFRSVPFIILLVALFPMAKAIVGKTYGSEVMILALTVAAIPYISRVVESSLNEVDKGVVEAASSIGANSWQIITKVILPESKPSLLVGSVIAATTILGYSAMAGVVGGGGFIAGEKLGEKNAAPETTVESTTTAAVNEEVVPETTEKVVEEEPVTVTENVIVTEEIIYVTEKSEEPESKAVKPTEKVTESATKVNKKSEAVKTTSEAVKKISRDEAKKIALNHAGLKEADVRGLEVELDFEKGAYEYEVSFESGKYDYDYDIDAVSGKIKFSEKDLDD